MYSNEIVNYSGSKIVVKIQQGQIGIKEVVMAFADRIEKVESKVKAWKYYDRRQFLGFGEIAQRDFESGRKKTGKLLGIPVGVKDIFNTKDMSTCMGSQIWEGFTPGNNARAVDYVLWEGGIVAGKTITAEFAVHHPGPTLNPRNPEHISGTSSSGSAAAVAAGMVPMALGTQTAGSTIRPASYCGIYGFKPSFGTIPRTGILKTLDTLDHICMLTRYAEDLRIFFDTLRVKGENFPFVHKTLDKYSRQTKKALKVAFIHTETWKDAQPYAKDAITNFANKLGKINQVIVEEFETIGPIKDVHRNHNLVYEKALSYYFQDEYRDHREKLSAVFLDMVERGQKISTLAYKEALQNQVETIYKLDEFFDRFDFILTLSTSGEAPGLKNPTEPQDPTLIWTYAHVPAISVPAFTGPLGLPFGAQLVTKRYDDYRLIDFVEHLYEEGIIADARVALPL